jgi:hypothetical protein
MEYKIITQDEQDEHLVNFLRAQETDHYLHQINIDRYEQIIADETITDQNFKSRIAALIVTERAALAQVAKIIEHTADQVPTKERIDAAVSRLTAKGVIA